MAARPLLKSGLRKTIGSGYNTRVWDELWLPSFPPRAPTGIKPIQRPNLLVYELIDRSTKTWNLELLKSLFLSEEIPLIMSMKISRSFKVDSYCWIHSKSGIYSVKTGYDEKCRQDQTHPEELCSEPSTTLLKQQVWRIKTVPKIQHFMWQAISDCLPVCSRLVDRHCHHSRTCPRCGQEDETVNHLLFECPMTLQIWEQAQLPVLPGEFPCPSLYSNFDCILYRVHKRNGADTNLNRIPWILWLIWKSRNDKVFNDKETLPSDVILSATTEAESWRLAQIASEVLEDASSIGAPEPLVLPSQRPFCRFDASWKEDDARVLHFAVGHEILATPRSRLDDVRIRLLATGATN
ncbi:Reverse transcriptase zinc-binding domain-containing protein [Hirschfeldia incana]|nr:Reverse transcriptase zinc-binding domain-containing protein [Hirschfeldia incana]